jgi:hypothetical protein
MFELAPVTHTPITNALNGAIDGVLSRRDAEAIVPKKFHDVLKFAIDFENTSRGHPCHVSTQMAERILRLLSLAEFLCLARRQPKTAAEQIGVWLQDYFRQVTQYDWLVSGLLASVHSQQPSSFMDADAVDPETRKSLH